MGESRESNFSFLMRVSKEEKYKLLISAVLSGLSSVMAVAPYILLYQMVLALLADVVDFEGLKKLSIWIAIVVVTRMAIFLSSGVFSHIAAFTILYELRMTVIDHIGKLNMGFLNNRTLGEVKKTINEDIEKLENFIAHQIPDLTGAIFSPLVIMSYLLYLDWRLALALFIPVILAVFTQFAMFSGAKERMAHYHHLLSNMNGTIIQYINGIQVMKAFNLSAKNFEKYKSVTEEYADYWSLISKKTSKFYGIFVTLIDSGLLVVIPFGGFLLINNKISIPAFVLFLLLSSVFLNSLKLIMEFGGQFSMLLEGAGRVKRILEIPPQENGRDTFAGRIKGKIEFENVSFKYDEKDVLSNVSLTIEPNKIVALVGPSGSGKTTIGQLLGRFWDVEFGQIRIDGKSIKDISIQELMNQVSFVFQQVFMLNDSIYENIRMGLDVTKEKVEAAAKKAQIHDFIMSLPKGYNTSLAEEGIKLSGGEKQRIAIARAILKDSPIIVLDEVTSYSDVENESRLQQALSTLLKGKTAIIIAHRLYTIKNVDEILVMDEGVIVERGKHSELMNKNGLYRRLWDIHQSGGEECLPMLNIS